MKGALYRWVLANLAGVVLIAATGAAVAVDVTDADRVFRNYTRETATVGENQIRLEVRGLREETQDTARLNPAGQHLPYCPFPSLECTKDLDAGFFDLIGSYGFGKNAEVGFVLTGINESLHITQNVPIDSQTSQSVTVKKVHDSDIGDIQLYTKFQRPVAQHCAVGAGVELSLPTGSRGKGLGTGELGVNPVASTRYQRGPLAVGGNIGYQIYTGDVVDVFNYGTEVIVRATEMYALRTELAGRLFEQGGHHFHDLTVLPGVDVNLASNLVIRPTGLVGVSPSAPDWGIGLGVAMTF